MLPFWALLLAIPNTYAGVITMTEVQSGFSTSFADPGSYNTTESDLGFASLPLANGMEGVKFYGTVTLQNLTAESTMSGGVSLETLGGSMTGVPGAGFLLNLSADVLMNRLGEFVPASPLSGAYVQLNFALQTETDPITFSQTVQTDRQGVANLQGTVFIPGNLSKYDWSASVSGSSSEIGPGQWMRMTVPGDSVDLVADQAEVPEPSTGLLAALALGGLAWWRRRPA